MNDALHLQIQEAERKVQEAETRMKKALHLQKEEAEQRSQDALRLQEERLREMDRKLQEKDDAVRSLQQRLQETHVRMTALEERTTAPEGSGGEGLQRLESRVNEEEASLPSTVEDIKADMEAFLRDIQELESTRATVATAAASARQEPASGGAAAGGGEAPLSSNSTPTPSGAGHQGAAADEEERARRRLELRVREVQLKIEEALILPSRLGEQLCDAAMQGRLSDVRQIIDIGVNVNYTDKFGFTPLLRAAVNAMANVVSFLLQRDADVNAVNLNGSSALHLAAMRDRSDRCVELLVRAGADVNARDMDGETPLHRAACNDNVEVVRALLAAGARTDLKPWGGYKKGRTPFETTTSPIIQDLLRLQ